MMSADEWKHVMNMAGQEVGTHMHLTEFNADGVLMHRYLYQKVSLHGWAHIFPNGVSFDPVKHDRMAIQIVRHQMEYVFS